MNMIGGLLKQVIMAQPNVPDEVMKVFRKSKRTALGLEDARHMLSEGLKSFHRTYLCSSRRMQRRIQKGFSSVLAASVEKFPALGTIVCDKQALCGGRGR